MTQSSRPQAGNITVNPAYIDAGPWSRDQWAERMYAVYTGDENTASQRTRLRGVVPTFDNMLVVGIAGGPAIPVNVATGAGFAGGSFLFNSAQVNFNPTLPGIASRTDKVVLVENNTNAAYDGTASGVVLYFPTDLTDYSGASSVPPYTCRLAILAGDAVTGNPTNLVQTADYWMIELARYNVTNLGVFSTLVDNREFINIETIVGVAAAENDTAKDALILGTQVNNGAGDDGLGVGVRFKLENDNGDLEDAGRLIVEWDDAANGNEDATYKLYLSAQNTLVLVAVINGADAASADGNARGIGAVDLQAHRSVVTQVASGRYAFVQGYDNTASGNYSSASGEENVASGNYAHAEGYSVTASNAAAHAEGYDTLASGSASHAEGRNTVASGSRSHAEGYSTTASEESTHAGGYSAVASKRGQFARGAGLFALAGDAQYSDYHIYRQVVHSDANWYELYTDGGLVGTRITVATDQVMTFECMIVGTTQGCGKSFAFRIVGIIENDGGTTTLLASTVTTIYDGDDTDFDARASADDANDALLIEVTDSTSGGNTVRWSAFVRTAEVTFPA